VLRLVLISGASWLALTAPAYAIPAVALGISSILGAIGVADAVIIGTLTVSQAIASALVVGGTLALSAIASGQKSAAGITPSEAKENFENAETPEVRAFGRVRVGGLVAFGNSENFNRWRLIWGLKGPVDAVETYYLGSREVTVDASTGAVTSPPYVKADGSSYIYIKTKLGTAVETAWTELISAFPALWTAAHRCQGIYQTLVQYISPGVNNDKYLKLFGSGLPDLQTLVRGEPIYDPRSGITAWSDNGILIALHVAAGFPGLTLADFDLDQIAAEADRADVPVDTKTGQEPRARAWGIWSQEAARGDTLKTLLRSIGAEIVPRPDDRHGIVLIDDDRPGEITLAARHMRSFQIKSGPEQVERPNVCIVKYYSPERNYDIAEIDMTGIAWARVQQEIDLVGEKQVTFELSFCPSAAQAQRIARRLFAEARADTGTVTTDMAGMATWGARCIDVEVPDLGEIVTVLPQPPRTRDDSGEVEIAFAARPVLDAYNANTDEALPPQPIPDLSYTSADVTAPDMPTSATCIVYPDATYEVRMAFTVPGSPTSIESTYRSYAGALPSPWTGMTEVGPIGGLRFSWAPGDYRALPLDFRVRVFNATDDASNWSPVLSLVGSVDPAAPSAPTGTWDGAYIVATAPISLNVAYLRFTGALTGVFNVRPGQQVTAPLPQTAFGQTVTITAYSSTDAPGTPVTVSVPGSGGGA